MNSQAASGAGSYGFNWTVTQPIETGYVVRVWYVDGSGNWLVFDDSSPSFAIAAGTVPAPTVTLPRYRRPLHPRRAWSRWPGRWPTRRTTGMFHTYAYKDGTYHWLNSQAASGRAPTASTGP